MEIFKAYKESGDIPHINYIYRGALNLIPHPQHLLAVPGLPYLKRTKPPHSR